MLNLGKARVKAELYNSLPNITKDRFFFDFDISAHSWNILSVSPYFPPLLTENIVDETEDFSVCFPSKRKYYIDNYITDGSGQSIADLSAMKNPYILWTPTIIKQGMVNEIVTRGNYGNYILQYPGKYPLIAGQYNGPQWADDSRDREALPSDDAEIAQWLVMASRGASEEEATTSTPTSTTTPAGNVVLPKINYVNQKVVQDGLWWGIESNDFLYDNMPFWVTIKRSNSPSTENHQTFIVISLGIGSNEHAYDLYISNNKKPMLVDYYKGRDVATDNGLPPSKTKEFTTDLAKIFESDSNLEIGFMTIGGRLVIFVNKVILIYTRVITNSGTDSGRIQEAKIAKGKIRIYGSNSQAVINVSPMTFASTSCMALPIPVIPVQKLPGSPGGTVVPVYKNVNYNGTVGKEPVCVLPSPPSVYGKLYGVDCEIFRQEGMWASPSGFAMHRQGIIVFAPASDFGITGSSSEDFYVLVMRPYTAQITFTGVSYSIPFSACPYFFRLKGGFEKSVSDESLLGVDVSDDLISATESYQLDDYFAMSGSATIILYNKGGKYDYLKDQQQGIRLYWGWGDDLKLTFTGLIISTSVSEVPGKEEITLTCQDYSYILKNFAMMNSPFYDGMVLYYAARNVIRRSGINIVINDWDNTDDYFLPTGYSFSKPAVRFDDNQPLYDCVKFMAELGEACFYFDQYGKAHILKIPGGLYSDNTNGTFVAEFVRNPDGENVILDQKNVEYDLSDTVNRIVIATLDRETRNTILYSKDAIGYEDRLLYRRIGYEDQSALGSWDVAVERTDELAQRVFFGIRKTSFKTADFTSIIYPLSFIKIDKDEFRLIGLSRKYSADSNDFTIEYNAEWLGG